MHFDTKNYEFTVTAVAPIKSGSQGKVEPPPGERWTFIQMTPTADGGALIIWVKPKH